MFKSKIDFNAFDKNNDKVADLELNKVKGLAKASVKKLKAQVGEHAKFHLVLDYFKDDKEKPQGHFLCFGVNKKMDKHFEQVEMKSGKLDKSMSANQKEASMGEAYVKEEAGKPILCFDPAPASKIPGGKWPKILKALKPFLNGMKAVVVIGGQEMGEEEDAGETTEETTEENTTDTAEAPTGETAPDPSSETTEASTTEETAGEEVSSANFQKLEEAYHTFEKDFKAMKSEKDSKAQANAIEQLFRRTEKLLTAFGKFSDRAQGKEANKTKRMQNRLGKYQEKLTTLNDKVYGAKSNATVKQMDKRFTDIIDGGGKIGQEHMQEIEENLPDLAKVLQELEELKAQKNFN